MAQQGEAMNEHELRRGLKAIEQEIKRNKDSLSRPDDNTLLRLLAQQDELQKHAVKPRDHAKDLDNYVQLTAANLEATKKLTTAQGRTPFDFILALRSNYVMGPDPSRGMTDPDAFNWHDMAARASVYLHPAPGVSCMLGPMDAEAKVRKVAQRKAKQVVGELTRPDDVAQIQENDKQETDRNMEEMWRVLHTAGSAGGSGPIPFAELVCNHRSFAQTVENVFTLSFLVRDQRVSLAHDEDMGMAAKAVDRKGGRAGAAAAGGAAADGPGTSAAGAQGGAAATRRGPGAGGEGQQGVVAHEEQKQFIIDFTIGDWEEMCMIVSPRDTKMSHREQQVALEQVLTARAARGGPQQGAGSSQAQAKRGRERQEAGGEEEDGDVEDVEEEEEGRDVKRQKGGRR